MRLGLGLGLTVGAGGGALTPAAPNIYSVTITGDPYVGSTLTANVGVTGYPTPSLTYQWKRDGVDISGATSSDYTAVEADDGTDLTVTVTATNTEGSDSATSAAVSISAAVSGAFSSAFSSAFDVAA